MQPQQLLQPLPSNSPTCEQTVTHWKKTHGFLAVLDHFVLFISDKVAKTKVVLVDKSALNTRQLTLKLSGWFTVIQILKHEDLWSAFQPNGHEAGSCEWLIHHKVNLQTCSVSRNVKDVQRWRSPVSIALQSNTPKCEVSGWACFLLGLASWRHRQQDRFSHIV